MKKFAILAALLFTSISVAREASYVEIAEATAELAMTLEQKGEALVDLFPIDLPNHAAGRNIRLLVSEGMAIGYDFDSKVAAYVAHRIEAAELGGGERVDAFRPDPRLAPQHSAMPFDYQEPIFDRGHLAPSADFAHSVSEMANSCLLSNVVPQLPGFNRVTWLEVERRARELALEAGWVACITGTAYDFDENGQMDRNLELAPLTRENSEIRVPSHYFKAIYVPLGRGDFELVCYLLPHLNEELSIEEIDAYYLATPEEIEAISGIALPL